MKDQAMTWQDKVLALGQGLFVLALIPTVMSTSCKPPLSTSIPTAIILTVFAWTFSTLRLPWAANTSLASAVTWLIITIQQMP